MQSVKEWYSRLYENECNNSALPAWLRRFNKDFQIALAENLENAKSGNRNTVCAAFSKAFDHLLPAGVKAIRRGAEMKISRYIPSENQAKCGHYLREHKTVDFVLRKEEATTLAEADTFLVEFKTNLTFNDLAAAMLEMAAVKKFASSNGNARRIRTASLHLLCSKDAASLKEVNEVMEQPLDCIWVFCKKGQGQNQQQFNVTEIEQFRNDVGRFFGLPFM